MQYEIKSSPDFAMIDCELDAGESIVSESGAMVSMSTGIKMKTDRKSVV